MRPTLDKYFLNMAAVVATRATCLRRSVGCVLTDKNGHVLSTGYNGRPAGWPHCNEVTRYEFATAPERDAKFNELKALKIHAWIEPYQPFINEDPAPTVLAFHKACDASCAKSGMNLDGCDAIHAEQNALLQCADVNKIFSCYVTTAPCVTCTKLLLNTACQNIVFHQDYMHTAKAQELWAKSNRNWKFLPT